jgi:MFS family permease
MAIKSKGQLARNLATVFSIVFIMYLIMGASVGVLPAFVHDKLNLSNVWVGLIIGIQYIATLFTRQFSGSMADHRGGKITLITGIGACMLSGGLLLAAVSLSNILALKLVLIIIGRILLGIGESYLLVGVFSWAFAVVGTENIGKVMVWNGMGMYAGIACGAPAAIYLDAHWGLSLLFIITIALPLISRLFIQLLPSVPPPQVVKRLPFYKAVMLVLAPGSGLALASIGFGGIASFITLYFSQQHWPNASLALTAFAAGNVLIRIIFGWAPDRFGGAKVAVVSLGVEIIGQLCVWSGTSGTLAIVGTFLTGAGMSLVFSCFGKIAVNQVALENRGTAIAAYNAFFDIGLGLTPPIAGVIVGKSHYSNVYLMGTVAAVCSLILAIKALRREAGGVQRLRG